MNEPFLHVPLLKYQNVHLGPLSSRRNGVGGATGSRNNTVFVSQRRGD